MNAGVSSEKEKVKESQSQRDTPSRHPLRVSGRGRHKLNELLLDDLLVACWPVEHPYPGSW